MAYIKNNRVQLTVLVKPEVFEKLEKFCLETGRARNRFIAFAIEKAMEPERKEQPQCIS